MLFFTIFILPQYKTVEAGGEIPWPLSNQRVITMNNSKGLWRLENSLDTKLFNVEIMGGEGSDWVRVAELHPRSLEVLSWGEGYFSNCKADTIDSDCKNLKTLNSFSNIFLGPVEKNDDHLGRYLDMFPNGDLDSNSYLLRLVEVKTSVGNVLGLSIINFEEKKYEHFLGTRLLANPMRCKKIEGVVNDLTCEFSQ
jgi:hypothetical protein